MFFQHGLEKKGLLIQTVIICGHEKDRRKSFGDMQACIQLAPVQRRAVLWKQNLNQPLNTGIRRIRIIDAAVQGNRPKAQLILDREVNTAAELLI